MEILLYIKKKKNLYFLTTHHIHGEWQFPIFNMLLKSGVRKGKSLDWRHFDKLKIKVNRNTWDSKMETLTTVNQCTVITVEELDV